MVDKNKYKYKDYLWLLLLFPRSSSLLRLLKNSANVSESTFFDICLKRNQSSYCKQFCQTRDDICRKTTFTCCQVLNFMEISYSAYYHPHLHLHQFQHPHHHHHHHHHNLAVLYRTSYVFPLAAILVQHPHAARGKHNHAQSEKNYFSNSVSGSEYAEVMLFFNITSDQHKHSLIFLSQWRVRGRRWKNILFGFYFHPAVPSCVN